jgi:hypothetical protein
VDFDGPIQNGITTYRPRSCTARAQQRQTSGEVGTAEVTDSDLARLGDVGGPASVVRLPPHAG